MTYQGSCEAHRGKSIHIKLLVDDHLIIGDSRTPNVPQRHLLTNPISGKTATQFDQWVNQHHLPFELATLPIFQSTVIFLGDIGLSSVIFGGTM
jgi:hypothetical protein